MLKELIAFVYASGIFAAALSTIPGLGGTISQWFRSMLNILFWTLTLTMLDRLVAGFSEFLKEKSSLTGVDLINVLVVNIVISFMYISVPVLTTIYIGGSAITGVIGKAQGFMGGMAGSVAGGAGRMAGSAWEKSAGSRNNAINSIKGVFKGNSTNRSKQ